MKVITYDYEEIKQIPVLFQQLSFSGFEAAEVIAKIGTILNSGQIGEMEDDKSNGSKDSTSHN